MIDPNELEKLMAGADEHRRRYGLSPPRTPRQEYWDKMISAVGLALVLLQFIFLLVSWAGGG
jgi:hypothetical protein